MVEILVTRQEAKEMRDAIKLLEQTEVQQTKILRDARMTQAEAWYNTIEPPIPTTRQEALDKFHHIEILLKTERNEIRHWLLNKKLNEANEKFKELKKLG